MPSSMSWPNGSFTAFRIPKETKYEIVQLISCSLCQLPLIDQLQHWNHLSSYIIIQNHTSMFLTRFCFSHLCLIQQPARQPRQPVAKVVGRLQVLGIHVYMSRGEQVNILLWLFMTDLTCWNLPLFSWQLGGCSPETGILSLHKFFIPIIFAPSPLYPMYLSLTPRGCITKRAENQLLTRFHDVLWLSCGEWKPRTCNSDSGWAKMHNVQWTCFTVLFRSKTLWRVFWVCSHCTNPLVSTALGIASARS